MEITLPVLSTTTIAGAFTAIMGIAGAIWLGKRALGLFNGR